MEKHSFAGKTKEEAIQKAKEELQEVEENLIIKEVSETKGGLFKSKKVEIEVIEKREVQKYIIYSDNDALLIGKNGKNLKALSTIVSQHITKETGKTIKFLIDVNEYKQKREKSLEGLAKRVAREVAATKIEVKLDSMNSYERRIIHNILTNNKKVYTESEGEEPNRYVVVKPKED